jgi:2-polyprenyl-6-methoxyphenol hydroxylase-like FAD-dependent oxidoreductase
MSTFVVETDEATFFRCGLDAMDVEAARDFCERVFAHMLGGASLISNKSIWRQFPRIWNQHWFVANRVLVGDALHTTHFSIGSGTRLAMEDAIALARALEDHRRYWPHLPYEEARKPRAETHAATPRGTKFCHHMRLAPLDFAAGYITLRASI